MPSFLSFKLKLRVNLKVKRWSRGMSKAYEVHFRCISLSQVYFDWSCDLTLLRFSYSYSSSTSTYSFSSCFCGSSLEFLLLEVMAIVHFYLRLFWWPMSIATGLSDLFILLLTIECISKKHKPYSYLKHTHTHSLTYSVTKRSRSFKAKQNGWKDWNLLCNFLCKGYFLLR